MKITFDPVKSADTVQRRGFGFDVVAGFDWGNALYAVDDRRDYGEVREIAIGSIESTVFVVVFTRRDDALHVISVRHASRKERARYART